MPPEARGAGLTGLSDRRFSRRVDQADDFDEATPSLQLAILVIALAAGLACLPGAVAVAGLLGAAPPPNFGLELAGTFLICFKVLSMVYAIGCQVLAREIE